MTKPLPLMSDAEVSQLMGKPKIGDRGWRPSKVHPLAELFPTLSDEDLAALADHIKANGLQVPIVISKDGMLIDGRMRLEACDKAGVEPQYQFLNGHDPEEYIWGANGKRRQMTKGQMAMIAACSFAPKEQPGGRKGKDWRDEGKAKAARAAGVSAARLSIALTVKKYAGHLVQEVIDGARALDDAHRFALAAQRAQETENEKLERLRKADRELAQRVTDQEITIDEALRELDDRVKAEATARDAVFLNMVSLTRYASAFAESDVLSKVPGWLATEDGQRNQDRYFEGGAEEVLEKVAQARRGLDAVEATYREVAARASASRNKGRR